MHHPVRRGSLFPLGRSFTQTIFMFACVAFAIYVMFDADDIYNEGPPQAVALIILVISPLLTQAVAVALQGQWMWPPSTQFLSFLAGNTVCLPIVGVMIALAVQDLPTQSFWWQGPIWTVISVVSAVGFAIGFRMNDLRIYEADSAESPNKLWYDIFVVPTLFFLLVKQAPALFSGDINPWRILLALLMVAVWLVLGLKVDPKRSDRRVKAGRSPLWRTAHPPYNWRIRRVTSK
jgi:hypothetical protein